jgi:hypothetical protein
MIPLGEGARAYPRFGVWVRCTYGGQHEWRIAEIGESARGTLDGYIVHGLPGLDALREAVHAYEATAAETPDAPFMLRGHQRRVLAADAVQSAPVLAGVPFVDEHGRILAAARPSTSTPQIGYRVHVARYIDGSGAPACTRAVLAGHDAEGGCWVMECSLVVLLGADPAYMPAFREAARPLSPADRVRSQTGYEAVSAPADAASAAAGGPYWQLGAPLGGRDLHTGSTAAVARVELPAYRWLSVEFTLYPPV